MAQVGKTSTSKAKVATKKSVVKASQSAKVKAGEKLLSSIETNVSKLDFEELNALAEIVASAIKGNEKFKSITSADAGKMLIGTHFNGVSIKVIKEGKKVIDALRVAHADYEPPTGKAKHIVNKEKAVKSILLQICGRSEVLKMVKKYLLSESAISASEMVKNAKEFKQVQFNWALEKPSHMRALITDKSPIKLDWNEGAIMVKDALNLALKCSILTASSFTGVQKREELLRKKG